MRKSYKKTYEPAEEYEGKAFEVKWHKGIAFRVSGWETAPDKDTEWTGIENRTGNLLVYMVGDDMDFSVEPSELTEIKESEYCHTCGQIGCKQNTIEEE